MSGSLSFTQAAAWLDGLQQFTIKLGLDTTRSLLADLGSPERGLPVLHIAGTNGKGSVGATLATILTTAGYRTGFYSS
ncbi:MAG: bifunctional folylpolyglutamate synthase/dihydrofolate synthase, partial [Desulfobulbus sp.]|nr:bifunctional folylpolyglutamate synthase/dihydrofolate synthase [Desulfobulbus sp.]